MAKLLVVIGALALAAGAVAADIEAAPSPGIFPFGEEPDGLQHHTGTPWDYEENGADWAGVNDRGTSWVCLTGKEQSPINVVTALATPVSEAHRSQLVFGSFKVSSASGVSSKAINSGHNAKLAWEPSTALATYFTVSPSTGPSATLTSWLSQPDNVPAVRVAPVPLQMHFHAPSEHLINGRRYPAELHIVSKTTDLPGCKPDGCLTVVGIMFGGGGPDAKDNPWLQKFLPLVPLREGAEAPLAEGTIFDVSALIPDNATYYTYAGSLTTPPCREGVLWHVLVQPQEISEAQVELLQLLYGENNCTVVQEPHMEVHRRLMRETQGSEPHGDTKWHCTKLPEGHNARQVQPLNNRSMRVSVGTSVREVVVQWDEIKEYYDLTVKFGDTITFVWNSGMAHGVAEGKCRNYVELAGVTKRGTFSVKPTRGEHTYISQSHCPWQRIKVNVL